MEIDLVIFIFLFPQIPLNRKSLIKPDWLVYSSIWTTRPKENLYHKIGYLCIIVRMDIYTLKPKTFCFKHLHFHLWSTFHYQCFPPAVKAAPENNGRYFPCDEVYILPTLRRLIFWHCFCTIGPFQCKFNTQWPG